MMLIFRVICYNIPSNSKGDGSMKFIISGKNITVTDGLRTAVEDKLGKLEGISLLTLKLS